MFLFALAPMRTLRMATMDGFAMVNVEGNAYLIFTLLLPFYYSPYSRTDYPVKCTVGHISESLYSFRATVTWVICPSSARITPFYNCVAIIFLKNRSHALQSQVSRIMWQRIIAWQLCYCTRCIISCCLRCWTGGGVKYSSLHENSG